MTPPEIQEAVRRALAEDIGEGDLTTNLTIPAGSQSTARIFARQPLTLAGTELIPLIFDTCTVELHHSSGAHLPANTEIAKITGPTSTLLTRERTALNYLQRLSGIATLTRAYVEAIAGTRCKILDTRKTTPGLRLLEKMATAAGGATNHRMGLYDAILIKNNHITASGGVAAALARTRDAGVQVEIEVRTKAELEEALAHGAKHLLLDNLTPQEARQWIATIAGRAKVELSGGITLATVRAYAATGADYISVGALTHSAKAVDINLRLE